MSSANDTANDPVPAPTALHLWRVLRAYIAHACNLIGMPAALAQRLWLTRAEYRQFNNILRPLEALLRRLVFLDAIQLPPELPRVETKNRPRRDMPAGAGAHFHPEHPETWRARFDLGPMANRRSPVCARNAGRLHTGATPKCDRVASAPLALRLEAVIRGFNDPAPLARRLARHLQRAPRSARTFTTPPRRCDAALPFFYPVAQAGDLCAVAAPGFSDSS